MDFYRFARVARATNVFCSLVLVLPAANSQAQTEDAAELGRITVTGSHISRLDVEGPSPVLVLNRQDIERTGVMTVGELLQQLPIDSGGTFNDLANNTFAGGGTGVSLRGLGA
ncbi:MAG: Plug domain-containing protein, partial [Gammaproteobacteria bacterium]